jgi:hypothetical protein
MTLPDGLRCDLLSLPDLVQAKKTQRDKDWPMLRRLVEANYFQNRVRPTTAQIKFWLRELRTPELLIDLARQQPCATERLVIERPLLRQARSGDAAGLQGGLEAEERREREADRQYWAPLRAELEALRHAR